MEKKTAVRFGLSLAAALIMMGSGLAMRGNAPEGEKADPPAALDASDSTVRVGADCQITQTMGFTRCGHSVTRRIMAPPALTGADFAAAQEHYALWQIESFTAAGIEMQREIPLFCPLHQVLSADEAGEIVLTYNAYGDGMAVRKGYGRFIGEFETEDQEKLLLGLGFDTEEEADAWMAAH